ncbi:MAG: hypothetical protein V3T05_10800 [Myxococcota bacterium]
MLRKTMIVVLVGCLTVACGEEVERSYSTGDGVNTVTHTRITAAAGGTAQSYDRELTVDIGPGMVDQDITLTISNAGVSPAPAATLSKLYRITYEPATASFGPGFLATLDFVLDSADVARVGATNLGLAWREGTSGPFEAVEFAMWDEPGFPPNTMRGTVTHFSDYAAVDQGMFYECTCGTEAGCQTGCEFCDPDCGTQDGDPTDGGNASDGGPTDGGYPPGDSDPANGGSTPSDGGPMDGGYSPGDGYTPGD